MTRAGPVAPSSPGAGRESRSPGTLASMADDDTGAPWVFRFLAIAVVVVVAWVLLWPVLSLARSLVAIALYVIVGVIAYQVGKVAGRASRAPRD